MPGGSPTPHATVEGHRHYSTGVRSTRTGRCGTCRCHRQGGEPIGYAYANTVDSEDRWWKRVTPAPSAEYTDRHAVALKEIGVRVPWRGTGTARRIHDTLLADRSEPYVTLMVNPLAGDGRVHRLYESWGYEDIGRSQPSAAAPVLTTMIRSRPLRQPTAPHPGGL